MDLLIECEQPNNSMQGERKMATTRSFRCGQVEIGVIENNGVEYAAYGATVCGRETEFADA